MKKCMIFSLFLLDYTRGACGAEGPKISKICEKNRFCSGLAEFKKIVVSRTKSRCGTQRNIGFTSHFCIKTQK